MRKTGPPDHLPAKPTCPRQPTNTGPAQPQRTLKLLGPCLPTVLQPSLPDELVSFFFRPSAAVAHRICQPTAPIVIAKCLPHAWLRCSSPHCPITCSAARQRSTTACHLVNACSPAHETGPRPVSHAQCPRDSTMIVHCPAPRQ